MSGAIDEPRYAWEPDFVFWPLRLRDGTELWRFDCWGHGYDANPDDEGSKTRYAQCYLGHRQRHASESEARAAAAEHAAEFHRNRAAGTRYPEVTATRKETT